MKQIYISRILAVLSVAVVSGASLFAKSVVHVEEAGTLSSLFAAEDGEVQVSGSINGTDVKYLRQRIEEGAVTSLDLSEVRIVSGGEAYHEAFRTEDDVFGESMFTECANLEYVVLPKSVSTISANAFSRTGLKRVEIPNNIRELDLDAFAYCKSLDTVVIGSKVLSIGKGVFYGSSVKVAYVKPIVPPSIDYYLFSSNPDVIVYNESLGDYEDSYWTDFATIKGGLDELYAQEADPAAELRQLLTTFFMDDACTELKAEYKAMSDSELSQAMGEESIPDDIVAIALKIKNEEWAAYEKDFRIHIYPAYSDANYWNTLLMSTGGSYMGNPTGIYSRDNAPIYVFVDQDVPNDATLFFTGCVGNDLISSAKSGTKLHKGLNIIDGYKDALYYIVYTADTRSMTKKLSEWPAIKIHIEGGVVNGYYDLARHSDAAYAELLENATHELFTVKGAETLLNFKTSTYRELFPSSIDHSLVWFDSLTVWEKELMGICESVVNGQRANAPYNLTGGEAYFPIYYNNPNFAIEGEASDDGYANSSPYRTSYNSTDCISNTFDVTREDQDDWCAAHECGHNNQGAINLEGCTEVSNNLFSNVICFLDGRLTSKGLSLSTTMNSYAHHTPYFTRDVSSMMRMYYQLYLYYHQARKNTSFYPTLFQELRKDPLTLWTDTDNSSLKFVRKVCEVAQEDLTDFFTAWGFFEPCELTIDDYGVHTLSVSQEDIDKTLAEISKYPKKNREILFVEDRADYLLTTGFLTSAGEKRVGSETVGLYANLGQFTDFLSDSVKASSYTYMQADSFYAMSGEGGIGFWVQDDEGKMLYAANTLSFCIPSCVGKNFTIYSVDADGTMHEVTKRAGGLEVVHLDEPGTLSDSLSEQAIKAVVSGPINGTDIQYLRKLINEGALQSVDLSGATIVSGGEAYYETFETASGEVGEDFFYECPRLVSLILPQSVTCIGQQAFAHSGLQGVVIPDSVTNVQFDAFAYCDQLSNVVIGSGVKRIEQGAFYSSEVKDVYVKPTTPPSVSLYLFSSEPTIHVPASALEEYKASAWAEFGTIVGDLEDYDLGEWTSLQQPITVAPENPGGDSLYDLFGRSVKELRPSTIYVKNGKKRIWVK